MTSAHNKEVLSQLILLKFVVFTGPFGYSDSRLARPHPGDQNYRAQ